MGGPRVALASLATAAVIAAVALGSGSLRGHDSRGATTANVSTPLVAPSPSLPDPATAVPYPTRGPDVPSGIVKDDASMAPITFTPPLPGSG